MDKNSSKKRDETGGMQNGKQAICRKMEGYRHWAVSLQNIE